MANEFDLPSESTTDADGRMPVSWGHWFSLVNKIINALRQAGPTADRPSSFLWVGRRYFDTTLGLPVYLKTLPSTWVNAAGAAV